MHNKVFRIVCILGVLFVTLLAPTAASALTLRGTAVGNIYIGSNGVFFSFRDTQTCAVGPGNGTGYAKIPTTFPLLKELVALLILSRQSQKPISCEVPSATDCNVIWCEISG